MTNTITLYIQLGFLLHLIGDYLLQTSWMANEKVKRFFPAAVHAFSYSLLFFFLTNLTGWLIILITHFFIDRYRLAVYWIKLINDSWDKKGERGGIPYTIKSSNFGYPETLPIWLSTWLLFIVDNTFHLIINTIVIYFTNK